MAYHESPQGRGEPQEDEALFVPFRVVPQQCTIAEEDSPSLFERNAVLPLVLGILALIPLESQLGNVQSITTL